jgi:hypothetical protein
MLDIESIKHGPQLRSPDISANGRFISHQQSREENFDLTVKEVSGCWSEKIEQIQSSVFSGSKSIMFY